MQIIRIKRRTSNVAMGFIELDNNHKNDCNFKKCLHLEDFKLQGILANLS